MKWRPSLRFRILLIALAVETAAVIVFGAIAYQRSHRQMFSTLDELLQYQTEVFRRLVADMAGRDPGWIQGGAQHMGQLLRADEGDLYRIWLPDGPVIAQSPNLGFRRLDLPEDIVSLIRPDKGEEFHFRWEGEPYRARYYRARIEIAPSGGAANPGGPVRREVRIFCAEPTRRLYERLADFMEYYIPIGIGVVVLSALGLWWLLTRVGLRPLSRLSDEVGSVGPSNLEYRLDATRLPSDLRGLGTAVNHFLERLERAFAREKQFAADAAHELCTPISLMKANVQSALLVPADSASDRERLRELLFDVERLERLADSLLVLADGESGATIEHKDAVDARALVESIAGRFEQAARQTDVSVEVDGGNAGSLWTDAATLERIVGNLIDNAIKYNRRPGMVWISAQRSPDRLEIRVADGGPGIPEKDVPNLFERFFRVDKSRSRALGGAGLGLAIARSLCDAIGATIGYEPREGGGSVFIVRLPLSSPDDQDSTPGEPDAESSTQQLGDLPT